jgi:hypothetical protein
MCCWRDTKQNDSTALDCEYNLLELLQMISKSDVPSFVMIGFPSHHATIAGAVEEGYR